MSVGFENKYVEKNSDISFTLVPVNNLIAVLLYRNPNAVTRYISINEKLYIMTCSILCHPFIKEVPHSRPIILRIICPMAHSTKARAKQYGSDCHDQNVNPQGLVLNSGKKSSNV